MLSLFKKPNKSKGAGPDGISSQLIIDCADLICTSYYYTRQCKTQTADYCFHHANENVTTIVPLFSNPKNNSPQSVRSLHFTLPHYYTLKFNSSLANVYYIDMSVLLD